MNYLVTLKNWSTEDISYLVIYSEREEDAESIAESLSFKIPSTIVESVECLE